MPIDQFQLKRYEELEANPIALYEGIDPDEYIIATYYFAIPKGFSIRDIAQSLAIEQSTGTWVPVPGETPEMRKKHVAKVIGIYEIPDFELMIPEEVKERHFIIQIAFPEENIGEQIAMLFTTIYGNISLAGKLKLVNVWFPKKYVQGFKGPKFGIGGVRKILGVYDRPLICNMIKPCTGFPPEVGAKYAYEAARGGVDIIKDDELLANARFNTVEDRIVKYMEAIDRANEEKGEKTLYCINITDDIPQVFENADKVIELGANCIMINYLAAGFGVLRKLAEDLSIKVPIMGHMDVTGAFVNSPFSGVSAPIIMGKLPRLCGIDIEVYPAPYGKALFMKEKYLAIADALRYPFYHIKPTFPMPSGGIMQRFVPEIIQDLGIDVVIGVGGAIHAHPMGPAAGARAFRQAIDAVLKYGYTNLKKFVKEHKAPELEAALKAW